MLVRILGIGDDSILPRKGNIMRGGPRLGPEQRCAGSKTPGATRKGFPLTLLSVCNTFFLTQNGSAVLYHTSGARDIQVSKKNTEKRRENDREKNLESGQ